MGYFSLDSKIVKDRVTIKELEEYRKVRKSLFKEYNEQPDYLKEIILSDLASRFAGRVLGMQKLMQHGCVLMLMLMETKFGRQYNVLFLIWVEISNRLSNRCLLTN